MPAVCAVPILNLMQILQIVSDLIEVGMGGWQAVPTVVVWASGQDL